MRRIQEERSIALRTLLETVIGELLYDLHFSGLKI